MSSRAEYSGLQRLLDSLNAEVRGEMMLKALREGAKVLQDRTRANLRAALGNGAVAVSDKRRYPMDRGVRLTVDRAYKEVKVSIMGDFRLKWFEKGTKPRYTDGTSDRGRARAKKRFTSWSDERKRKTSFSGKPAYRGKIRGEEFFSSARAQSEPAIVEAVTASLDAQLNKILR